MSFACVDRGRHGDRARDCVRVRRLLAAQAVNHKRRRPKHQRAGCLMCKPHKDERVGKDQAVLGSGRGFLLRELVRKKEWKSDQLLPK